MMSTPKKTKEAASRAPKPPQPSRAELATIATLMAIHNSIKQSTEHLEPKDFLPDAYALLVETRRWLSFQYLAEAMNKLPGISDIPDDPLNKEYTWKEVLAVQKKAPAGISGLGRFVIGARIANSGTRVRRPDKEYGTFFFRHEDLVNRPVGISMVGSLGTNKALRNAIKRVFPEDEALASIDRKTLTIWEINRLIADQLIVHKGRIPLVRAAKFNAT